MWEPVRLRVTCRACGTVDVSRDDVVLLTEDKVWLDRPGSYAFTCPSCTNRRQKVADDRVLAALRRAGVPERTACPSWTGHPEHPADGAPFTRFDVWRFRRLLRRKDWFDRLAGVS